MPQESDTPQELKALESALATFAPAPFGAGRDGLMYRAGQASASRHQSKWHWPAATVVMSGVAAVLLVMVVTRPEPRVVERLVFVGAQAGEDRGQGEEGSATAVVARIGGNADLGTRPTMAAGLLGIADAEQRPEYLKVRDQVLALGLDGWQKPSGGSELSPPISYRAALDKMLNLNRSEAGGRSETGASETSQGGTNL